MAEIAFRFPSVFRRRVILPCGQVQSSARGTFCKKQCNPLCIFLQRQLDQVEVGRRKDHVLQFDNRRIEGWGGRHYKSST